MSSDPLTCLDVAEELAGVADHDLVSSRAGAHVAQCLRCQAEVAQYRRLARTMRELATRPPAAPAGLEREILLGLDDQLARRLPTRAAAALGGIAAAAGVLALAAREVTRQRRIAQLAV